MDLVLFGIQGSGKGTQAKRLAADFGYTVFEAGATLRSMAASGTELGNVVKGFIDQGNLVPHEIIMSVVRQAVQQVPADQAILFDGVPRDLNQMRDFDEIMQDLKRPFRGIHLLLQEDEAIARLSQRAAKENRADDADPAFIKRRLSWFYEKCMPVIEHYKAEGKMTEVDGKGDIDAVYVRLKEALAA